MSQRGRVAAAVAVALVAGLAVVLVLRARGGDDDGSAAPARPPVPAADALRLALAEFDPGAREVLVVETDTARALARLGQLVDGAAIALESVLGVPLSDVAPLLGHPVVVEPAAGRAAFVTEKPDDARQLLENAGRTVVVHDRLVVVGDPPARRGLTPAAFARRLAAIDTRGAVVRGTVDPRRLPAVPGFPGVRPTAAAIALVPDDDGATVRARLTLPDPPLARGPQAPAPRAPKGVPLVASVRDLATTIRRARELASNPDLDRLDDLLRQFAGIDLQGDVLDQLTGTTTITSRDGRTYSARGDVADPGKVDGTLEALDRVGKLAGLAGVLGVDLGGYEVKDGPQGTRSITKDDRLVVTLGVIAGALVLTNDPKADLDAIASAPPAGRVLPAHGALHAAVEHELATGLIVQSLRLPGIARLALGAIGDLTLDGVADDAGVTLTLRVPVRTG